MDKDKLEKILSEAPSMIAPPAGFLMMLDKNETTMSPGRFGEPDVDQRI